MCNTQYLAILQVQFLAFANTLDEYIMLWGLYVSKKNNQNNLQDSLQDTQYAKSLEHTSHTLRDLSQQMMPNITSLHTPHYVTLYTQVLDTLQEIPIIIQNQISTTIQDEKNNNELSLSPIQETLSLLLKTSMDALIQEDEMIALKSNTIFDELQTLLKEYPLTQYYDAAIKIGEKILQSNTLCIKFEKNRV